MGDIVNNEGMLPSSTERMHKEGARPYASLNISNIEAKHVVARIVDFKRDFPIVGQWFSEDFHYFDMSLSSRPAAVRARFDGVFDDMMGYGRAFFVPVGYRLHAEGPKCQQRNLNVYIRSNFDLNEDLAITGDVAQKLRRCLRLRDANIHRTLERIAQEICEPGFASELLIEGLGLTLIVEAARLLGMGSESVHKGGLPLWRSKGIEDRIQDGDEPPSLTELATLCGLSRRQLSRAFRQETGWSITAYVQSKMMDRAKNLLLDSELMISEISRRVGFTNAGAFATAFRKATGSSPRDFRSLHRARRVAIQISCSDRSDCPAPAQPH